MDKSIFILGFTAWLRQLATEPCWHYCHREHYGDGTEGPDDATGVLINTGSRAEIWFTAHEAHTAGHISWDIEITFDKSYKVKLYSGFNELAVEEEFAGVLAAATAAINLNLK